MSDGKSDLKSEIDSLVGKLNKYSAAYYKDARPLVSDAEYDRLYDRLVKLETEHPELKSPYSPTQRVGDDAIQGFEDVKHTIPVLSLDKAYGIADLENFRQRIFKAGFRDVSFSLEEKIDGLSVVLYYEHGSLSRAVTRGNGIVGSDITAGVKTIRSVPLMLDKPITIACRGELYLDKKSFERINGTLSEPYANARNLAAGLIKRQKTSEVAGTGLDIFIYEGFLSEDAPENRGIVFNSHAEMLRFLTELGFRTNPHTRFVGFDEFDRIDEFIADATSIRATLDYDIDGMVLKVDDFSIRGKLGYTQHHPRWAIAYKFESPVARSVLKDIQVQVGRTGRLTPVAVFDKTFLLGSFIENASLHNKGYINELEIAIGDEISFSKRGDVIPQVEEVLEKNESGNKTFRFPDKCPVCGGKVEDIGKNTFCINDQCPARIVGEAAFFVSKTAMDIEGIGSSTIQDLFDLGLLKDFTDLYFIDYEKDLFGKLEYKEKKVRNIIDGLEKSKQKDFVSVLVAIQIPEVGRKSAQILVDAGFDDMAKFIEAAASGDVESLSRIQMIGPKMAASIISFFKTPKMLARIERLKSVPLMMRRQEGDGDIIDDSLAGQVWCVTGSVEGFKNPDLAMEEVRRRGARIVSSVSSKTTHLLVGENPGSKLQKAIANGKTILVPASEFHKYLQK